MGDQGSSVTLVFYRMSDRWWKEPVLNIAAAACQMSNLTHVEVHPLPTFAVFGPLTHHTSYRWRLERTLAPTA